MGYSVFENTMADLTWQDIEKAAEKKAVILFPIGVMEEHGPHLPLGTDCYISYNIAQYIKKALDEKKVECLIAPPFYWGINFVTGGFPGSFTVKTETMKAVMKDTFECLKKWGFNNIYCISNHGDFKHIATINEAVKETRDEMNINVKFAVEEEFFPINGYKGDEDFILPVYPKMTEEFMDSDDEQPQGYDIHAGAYETCVMNEFFTDVTKTDVAETLKDTSLKDSDFVQWNKGGKAMRDMLPLGYAGNPAGYKDIKNMRKFEEFIDSFYAEAIIKDIN